MQEQQAVLGQITHCLDEAGIPYMLSGSLAMNYYATPRMTRAIDLVLEVMAPDLPRLGEKLGADYFFDEDTARSAVQHQTMFNILHMQSLVKIDCIIRKVHPYRQEEFSRRRQVRFGPTTIWIVSAEDLLLSKLDWLKDSRSELQFGDIRNLIRAVPTLDWDYLQHWANTLGIHHLLDEVRP